MAWHGIALHCCRVEGTWNVKATGEEGGTVITSGALALRWWKAKRIQKGFFFFCLSTVNLSSLISNILIYIYIIIIINIDYL
jgi:hypothetical protein